MSEVPDLDIVVAPIGGGGLFSGTAIAARAKAPHVRVVCAEPAAADDAFRSMREEKRLPSLDPTTIADGLRASISARTFEALRTHGREVVTVTEDEIIESMRFVWERLKIIIEPSSAVPVAAVMLRKIVRAENARIGVIITGGNVDLERLPWVTK